MSSQINTNKSKYLKSIRINKWRFKNGYYKYAKGLKRKGKHNEWTDGRGLMAKENYKKEPNRNLTPKNFNI